MINFFLGMAAGVMCVIGGIAAYMTYHFYKDGGIDSFFSDADE